MIARRGRRALALGVLTAISWAAPSLHAAGFDRESFIRWVEARAGTGKPVYWYSEGTVTEYPSGRVLARMEGFDTARLHWPDRGKDDATQLSRKIYIFRDAQSGEILREFAGKPVETVRFPYQQITYRRRDDQLETTVEQGSGVSRLTIGPSTGITVRRLGSAFAYTAPLYLDLQGPDSVRRTVFENYDFFIRSSGNDPRDRYQLSWVRYGNRGLFTDQPTITHMVSWRVDRFGDLPEGIRRYVEAEAPLWRNPPADFAEIERLQAQVAR